MYSIIVFAAETIVLTICIYILYILIVSRGYYGKNYCLRPI